MCFQGPLGPWTPAERTSRSWCALRAQKDFFSPQNMVFIIKYSFLGENTVFGITEYSFWFPEVGRSVTLRVFCDLISLFPKFGRCLYTIKNKLQSHLPTIMMALPLRVRKYKSPRQSETRSLRAIWWRVKGAIGNRVAMSYLERQTLTLVLSMFKTSAEGRRSGESDIDAVQSPWQRDWSLMSVLRTKQKHKKASWGPRIFPCGQWRI